MAHVEVAGVGQHDRVGGEEPSVPLQEGLEAGRADLLFALDEELEVQGQPARGLEPGARGGDVGDEGALVVHRPPAVEAAVALGRLEGRRDPLLRAAGRLDVVVAVDEQRRRALGVQPVPVDVGVLAGHLEEPHVLEAGLAQEIRGLLGRAAHLLGREALGGHARDADELGQARRHVVDVRFDVAECFVQVRLGHLSGLPGESRTGRAPPRTAGPPSTSVDAPPPPAFPAWGTIRATSGHFSAPPAPAAGMGGFMSDKDHKPYVPDDSTMSEFTVRALLLGLVMSVVLGSANAYLGLRAGMTIAATYPAAVIGMAVLRMMKGSLLEENYARTVGSIGESVAAGAIFTIPAFVILQIWSFKTFDAHGVPHRERPHDRGRHPGRPLRHPPAPRHGRGPLAALPRVGGRLRDPQGRPAGLGRRDAALRRHGRGRAHQAPGRRGRLQRLQHVHPGGREGQGELRPARAHQGRAHHRRGRGHHLPGPGREPGLPGRRLHHRARAGRPELRGRPPRLGPLRAAPRLLPRPAARARLHRRRGRHETGPGWPATCGASSSGRSRSAGCWSAPASPSSACGRTWPSASSAGSPTSRSRPPPTRPPPAPSATSPSRPSSSGSRSCSS